MERLVLSEEEKALGLNVGEAMVRRLILAGKKDCCWCSLHLRCGFEKKHYNTGFYCSLWELDKKVRQDYHITKGEVP